MLAYLDIETSYDGALTVVGLWRPHGGLSQWVSPDIDSAELLEALSGAQALYTYNGHRFDLPVIHRRLGLNLRRLFASRDLMYDCWRRGLYGGLKAVERQLGIPRSLPHLDGRDAMRLWAAYVDRGEEEALELLLRYNREDVENLDLLRSHLSA
ncbi:ribonuclease H-like domain-containing protein [Nitrospinae bacterium AH_259_B05_G02_I21]|nr:ribonuclease H-like domain-containing protein [Nitrospinae bacterium AH_259_B05_G02_I21]